MGTIAAVTSGTRSNRPIPRVRVTSLDVAIVRNVHSDNLDILWKTSILFGSPRPAWSGIMQFVYQGDHPGKASVMFLPMIDMNSNDTTCIYSTLAFVTEHARCHDVSPITTSDQSLWWNALMIIRSEPLVSDLRRIVLRSGGFHAEMSFLACIGHAMASSGLQELLELIYSQNAVVHIMLSGKVIARAVRAHFIVDAAHNVMMVTVVCCCIQFLFTTFTHTSLSMCVCVVIYKSNLNCQITTKLICKVN